MVKIAIAGGNSNVAQELVDHLVSLNKHEILILSRKDAPTPPPQGVTWVKANYEDTEDLARALKGVHTVLSFIIEQDTETSPTQRRLIDTAIQAGVKRFAPSEWASSKFDGLSWYSYKISIRAYLAELNKDKKVLEYALFHPGLFTNYLSRPYNPMKYLKPLDSPIDFNNRRAIIVDGAENSKITLTTIEDFSAVIGKALEYEGEWPVFSGIQGTSLTIGELLAIGEKVRGAPFKVEKVKKEDFEAGTWETSWVPIVDHPSIPKDQVLAFSRPATAGISMGFANEAFHAEPVWNGLLPDYKFTQVGEFLEEVWKGKS
ncbi:uncharacterized protein BDV14DRAFT_168989 [Aspergillus stella-maris]|uniref:uncharacterized protein n=1 Tax=Aspergillus stella-maris TaxID=1810926 RepID=UPI003CCDCE64